jgi:Lipocalin-like domain
MNRRTSLALGTTALLSLSIVLSGAAFAQQKSLKEQLVGSWIIVSNDGTAPDGKKDQPFGPNPKGILIFDANGQYSQTIVNSDVPKFKINNRLKGTPEENTAVVQGTTATFGTWSIDEASKTVTVRYVGGMFPNQAGTDSKRTVSVSGNELKVSNPATAAGLKTDQVWKRAM